MKCPVCNTKCNDNTQICQICAWEFSIWVSEISDEQRNLYNQKLKIARNNWQKLKQMKKKLQALEQNPVKTTHQPKKQKPVKPASENPPDLLLDPFETEDEYRSRIQNYGAVKAGTAKLIKEKYDINTGKFPVEIKKDKWITDNDLFHCYDPYIIAERDIARDIYNKTHEYPVIVHLEVHNRKLYCKSILLDTNQKQFEINNIFKKAIPSKNSFFDPITKMEFIYVPGGWFKMGDTFGDGENNEKPVHDVHLYGFIMGKYPVTQEQWEIVINNKPYSNKGKNYPVEMVSWDDTQTFIHKLKNRSKENNYRLPTEAEWEYAARSGGKNEKYAGGQNIEEVAWYMDNSNGSTQIVGQKSPNGLGLYDMSGNVWEWCEDVYKENSYTNHEIHNPIISGNNTGSRVLRGGDWYGGAWHCRAARRCWLGSGGRSGGIGFRLVSSLRSVI